MIRGLLRLFGLGKRRRRVYAQPPVPPPTPQRRRGKSEAAMPLPPGYIQARDAADPSPAPAPPKRKFGRSSMPLPPGQLQGPSDPEAARTRARQAAKAGRASPVALVRALQQPAPAARRLPSDKPAQGPAPARAPIKPRWSVKAAARKTWAAWRPRLWWAGRFGVRYVLPAAILVVVAGLVVRQMRHVGIVIMPISVPETLAASGRTPQVLAAHLSDRIEQVRRETLALRGDRPIDSLIGPRVPVGPPAPLLSRRGIASMLRDLIAAPVERVTGDIVVRPDGKLSLRLHMTGAGEIAARDGITADEVDPSLNAVAAQVWRIADPLLYAWYVSETEPRANVLLTDLRKLLRDPATRPQMQDPAALRLVSTLIAQAHVNAGDSGAALAELQQLGPAGNLYPLAWSVRAQALLQAGRLQEASAAQARVQALLPDSAWAHLSSARFDLMTGQHNEAYQAARAAQRIAPNDGAAAIVEAAALLALNRLPEAVTVARAAALRWPDLPGVQEALANALLRTGEPDKALTLYDHELRRHPWRISSLLGRARALQLLHRDQEALKASEAVLQLTPNNGTALLLNAMSLLQVKRPREALGTFDLLLQSRPNLPPLLQGKAQALAAMGRTADAVAVLEKLNKLTPGNAEVQAELKRLQSLAQ